MVHDTLGNPDYVHDCRCSNFITGNRGYGCTDATHAKSAGEQLLETLLLTLSNLAMLPAICVAIYRHYYAEALVYTYTMLFSTVCIYRT